MDLVKLRAKWPKNNEYFLVFLPHGKPFRRVGEKGIIGVKSNGWEMRKTRTCVDGSLIGEVESGTLAG